jgi:hypothetical protein
MARATTVVIASNDCAGDSLRIKRDSSAGAIDGLVKRGTSVGTVNHGRAGDEPETLAHRLLTSVRAFDLSATFRSMCDSVGGGA